jgi:TonB family protein
VADRLGLEGDVVVRMEIDENGRVAAAEVTAVRAVRNQSQLRDLALKSVRRRQYRPATWRGVPCRAQVEVTLKYVRER